MNEGRAGKFQGTELVRYFIVTHPVCFTIILDTALVPTDLVILAHGRNLVGLILYVLGSLSGSSQIMALPGQLL